MGVLSNWRASKAAATTGQVGVAGTDGLPVYSSPSSSSQAPVFKMKWSSSLLFFVALVVIAEIAFLGRLDVAKNAAVLDSWADSLFERPLASRDSVYGEVFGAESLGFGTNFTSVESDSCEEWLEEEDAVTYSRDFSKDPILVDGVEERKWETCAVGCRFGLVPNRSPDAAFGLPRQAGTRSVLRSMESAHYYSENNIAQARRLMQAT